MNYRHAFHAGNFADIVKHVALVAILARLKQKDTAFAVIDTHAGRGLYELDGAQAQKTGEASGGVARLGDLRPDLASLPQALGDYLRIVRASGAGRYPGSPLIAAQLLRPQDRLTAVEKHPEEAARLAEILGPFARAKAETADGYARLAALLPPPERRGLVLIDPPFEATDEFAQLAAAVRGARRRFATGIFLIWYPIKSRAVVDGFVGEVLSADGARALTIEIEVPAETGKLARAGLLVLNPPYGFDDEMIACLDVIAPRLDARTALVWRVRD